MEKTSFEISERYVPEWVLDIRDSMQLDSGIEVACLKARRDGHDYVLSVVVEGEVRVNYDGSTYRHANQMPRELLEYFGGAKEAVGNHEVDVRDNNWFEEVIWVDGVEFSSEVSDIDFSSYATVEDIISALLEQLDTIELS